MSFSLKRKEEESSFDVWFRFYWVCFWIFVWTGNVKVVDQLSLPPQERPLAISCSGHHSDHERARWASASGSVSHFCRVETLHIFLPVLQASVGLCFITLPGSRRWLWRAWRPASSSLFLRPSAGTSRFAFPDLSWPWWLFLIAWFVSQAARKRPVWALWSVPFQHRHKPDGPVRNIYRCTVGAGRVQPSQGLVRVSAKPWKLHFSFD